MKAYTIRDMPFETTVMNFAEQSPLRCHWRRVYDLLIRKLPVIVS